MPRLLSGTVLSGLMWFAPVFAQSDTPPPLLRHAFNAGVGMAQPRGDIQPFMSTSFALRLGYGFRVHRYLQLDAGFETVPHAAGVDVRQQTFVGEIRKTDSEMLIPLGGRAILPLARGWIELYGGGGVSYVRYGEDASLTDDPEASPRCHGCSSRDGWGPYAVAGVSVSLDRQRRFWLSGGTRWVRAKTSGGALGFVPAGQTQDRWLVSTIDFLARF